MPGGEVPCLPLAVGRDDARVEQVDLAFEVFGDVESVRHARLGIPYLCEMWVDIAGPADLGYGKQVVAGVGLFVPAVGGLEEFPVARWQTYAETLLVLDEFGFADTIRTQPVGRTMFGHQMRGPRRRGSHAPHMTLMDCAIDGVEK